MKDWERFVLQYGRRADRYELAAVVGQPQEAIVALRQRASCRRLKKAKGFAELFSLWHGREPLERDWPLPRKRKNGIYEWQAPELALLASLVGRLGPAEIGKVLTARLQRITGDRRAARSRCAVNIAMNHRLGMVTTDVVGGITASMAGREFGAYTAVWQAIRAKRLEAHRVGRLWVIPHEAWTKFKAGQVRPPAGYVKLNSIRERLCIASDKLSEYARMGYVPEAIQCNAYGSKANRTTQGTWYVPAKVASKLVADRRAGRPMPWHGKPMLDNLRWCYRLWLERKHPKACRTCAQIWGREGPPRSFEEYAKRYHPLAFGAKRHLSRKWSPGLTTAEVAARCGRPRGRVVRAIANGTLAAWRYKGVWYVSRSDAAYWMARRCPVGNRETSWISIDTAAKRYLFTTRQLRRFIRSGKLKHKVGRVGAMNGVVYVPVHQCAQLRNRLGFSEAEAARRAGVSVAKLRRLLKTVDWREAPRIPLVTVQAVVKRLQSRAGYTIEAAAAKLGATREWIHERIVDGVVRVYRAKWDRRRIYITEPMLERLKAARRRPMKRERLNSEWVPVSRAAVEAGVSIATICRWAEEHRLNRRRSRTGWRYHRRAVRRCARRYWTKENRLLRAVPPAWLQLGARA